MGGNVKYILSTSSSSVLGLETLEVSVGLKHFYETLSNASKE
jgi:hypothetical protein